MVDGSLPEVLMAIADDCRKGQRSDLADAIDEARLAAESPRCRVLVCGEFKVGKSRLVNAMLNADVTRADAEIATAEPVIVRYGPALSRVRLSDDDDAGTALVVTLPRRLLADGLELIDTPGVGRGLAEAHTVATLRALSGADALLFVSDAGKEFSAPELEFLVEAHRMCPIVVCALSKTDVSPHWRRILDLDRTHLADAGIEAPIAPVSSAVRQRALANRDRDLDHQSGVPALTDAVREHIIDRRRRQAIERAAVVSAGALDQRRASLTTERTALTTDAADELLAQLAVAERNGNDLRDNGRWHQTLGDRLEDLRSDVEADLSSRLLEIRKDVGRRVSEGAPAKVWPELEPWLYRRTNEELIEHFLRVREGAQNVAAQVLTEFGDLAAEVSLSIQLPEHRPGRGSLGTTAPKTSLVEAGVFAARGPTLSITVIHTVAAIIGLSTGVALPATALLGALLGRKTWRSARGNQLQSARTEMIRAASAYLEECTIGARKDSRDALRSAERQLRDELDTRARELHITALLNLEQAKISVSLDTKSRTQRAEEMDTKLSMLSDSEQRLHRAVNASLTVAS